MSSRPHAIPLALAGVIATAALAGCGSGAATIDPVAEAAVATTHAGGAHVAMNIGIDVEGLSTPMTLAGTGDLNFKTNEGELVSDLTGLPAAATGILHTDSISFTELYAKGALYMSSPLLDGRLPGGARWLKLDLAKLTAGSGLDLQSLTSGQSNPAQILSYLKAGGGHVTRLGTEAIRGTQTTHYRGTVDLDTLAAKAPAGERAQVRKAVEGLVAQMGSPSVPVEVWVDSRDLVRRMTLSLAESAAGAHVKVRLELELFDFGATPSVNPPAGGEVFDATESSLSALAGGV